MYFVTYDERISNMGKIVLQQNYLSLS